MVAPMLSFLLVAEAGPAEEGSQADRAFLCLIVGLVDCSFLDLWHSEHRFP